MGLASSTAAQSTFSSTSVEINGIGVSGDNKTKGSTNLLAAYLDSENETLISVTSNNIEYFSTSTGEVKRNENLAQVPRETAVGNGGQLKVPLTCVAFSSVKNLLATGDCEGVVRVYTTISGEALRAFTAKSENKHTVLVDKAPLTIEKEDDGAGVGNELSQPESDNNLPGAIEPSDNQTDANDEDTESLIGITSDNKTIRQKKIDYPVEVPSIPKSVCSIAILDNSHGDIVAGYDDGSIRRWNISPSATEPDLKQVYRIKLSKGQQSISPCVKLIYDEARHFLIAGYNDGIIREFSLEHGVIMRELIGHTTTIRDMCLVTRSDLLLTSGSDGILRVWDRITGGELGGYSYPTASMVYDHLRDLVFAETNGRFSVIKAQRDWKVNAQSVDSDYKTLPIIQSSRNAHRETSIVSVMTTIDQRSDTKPYRVVSVWYDTKKDALITATVTPSEGNAIGISVWSSVTSIPYDQAVAVSKQNKESSVKEDIVDENSLISELVEVHSQPKLPPTPSAASFDFVEIELQLVQKALQLFAASESATRKSLLVQSIYNAESTFQRQLQEENENLLADEIELANNSESILDEDVGRKQLEKNMLLKKEQLRARFEQQMKEIDEEYAREINEYIEQLPTQKKNVTSKLSDLKKAYKVKHSELARQTGFIMRNILKSSFPVLNDRYLIGSTISSDATSVFKGLDLLKSELVAIKAIPSMVPLTVNLRFSSLVPIYEICPTSGTTFVVMQLMRETLAQYVNEFTGTHLPTSKVVEIMYSILECLDYLHSNKMCARDLRPSSLFIDFDEGVKLLHLGIMKPLLGTEPTEDGLNFSAPEVYMKTLAYASDVWSAGCLLLYLLQTPSQRTKHIFPGKTSEEIVCNMALVVGKPNPIELETMKQSWLGMNAEGVEILNTVESQPRDESLYPPLQTMIAERCTWATPQSIDLLTKMLCFVPQKRISAAEALKHEYFENYVRIRYQKPLLTESGSNITTSKQSGLLLPATPSAARANPDQ